MAACVEAGAHHLDISGEPQFLERVQLNYHQVMFKWFKGLHICTELILTAGGERGGCVRDRVLRV